MLKNDNEGNFKIIFYALNLKAWKFAHNKRFGWIILRVFAVFTITFSKRTRFLAKKTPKN
jgi:hypothetical protein